MAAGERPVASIGISTLVVPNGLDKIEQEVGWVRTNTARSKGQ